MAHTAISSLAIACFFILVFDQAQRQAFCETGFQGWEFVSKHPLEMYGIDTTSINGSTYILGSWYTYEYHQEDPVFDRVWIFNEGTLEWSWTMTHGEIPERRRYYCTSNVGNRLYLFGGAEVSTRKNTNSMFSLDLSTFEWRMEKYKSGRTPFARRFMSCHSIRDRIYMYGGDVGIASTEFWVYDTGHQTWREIEPAVDEEANVPVTFNPYSGVYKDYIVYFGGTQEYFSLDYYYYYPVCIVWKYNTTLERWGEPVPVVGINLPSFGTASIIENSMYIFGGVHDVYWSDYSTSLFVLNLETLETEEVTSISPNYLSSYPIETPTPRMSTASASSGNRVIVFAGSSICPLNDFWVFDTEVMKWTESSLNKYPLGRKNPHITPISGDSMAVFGGIVCLETRQPINDLWIFNTREESWTRIQQESICNPEMSDCAPAVSNAAFGYWNTSLYLFGGLYDKNHLPIMKQFNLTTKVWANLNLYLDIAKYIGVRNSAASIFINGKFFMWGGTNYDGSTADSNVVVYDINQREWAVYLNSSNTPNVRRWSKGINIENQFCFVDNYALVFPNGYREMWCFDEDENEWRKNTRIYEDYGTSDFSLVAYHSNYISFGGWDTDLISQTTTMANLKSSYWSQISFQQTVPGKVFSSIVIPSTSAYIFAGLSVSGFTNGLHKLDLSKVFCDGAQNVSHEDGVITDGSGEFQYFPGTSCSWVISETNFLVVEYANLSLTSSLNLRQDKCGGGLLFQGSKYETVSMSSMRPGDFVNVLSGKSYLFFDVDKNGATSEGFSIRLFKCGLGFSVRLSGCVCEAGRYINFRGECIPCLDGYTQAGENMRECTRVGNNAGNENQDKGDLNMRQTESQVLSEGLPPLVFANSANINSSIYVIGGSLSADVQQTQSYRDMEMIYYTESIVNFKWKRMVASGDIPSRRVLSCFISMGPYAVLIGGKTEFTDNHVYTFNPSTRLWSRKSQAPMNMIGAQCLRNEDVIYVAGGENENGEQINSVLSYNPGKDEWRTLSMTFSNLMRSFGSMFFFQNRTIIFGGASDGDEDEDLLVFNDDFRFQQKDSITLQECLPCDDEGGSCFFARKHFSYLIHNHELHFYGGIRRSSVLADIVVVDLETMKVTHRQNYGLKLPDLPLSHPPPKFGSAFATIGSKMMIIGGATSDSNAVNDVWVWDAELKTWVDTSIIREPIHRKEPGLAKLDENRFVIYGGSTEYFSEVLLNDLWLFDLRTREWTLLSSGAMSDGPSPRAGAIVDASLNKIFVSGGRTDIGVTDENIWAFDTGTKSWNTVRFENLLSPFQRPFIRLGMPSINIGDTTWMWGGQSLPGSRRVEFYSAFIGYNKHSNQMFSNKIVGKTPNRRTYHSFCTADNKNISMYGGYDANGKALNEHWIYSTEFQTWEKVEYATVSQSPPMTNHACQTYGSSNILSGIDSTSREGVLWMIQHGFQRQAVLLRSDSIGGYERISHHGATMIKDVLISFGGTNGDSTSNQVVAYKPGFCSSKPKVLLSAIDVSVFDDGSGEGMYLEGTNCTWILLNATHLHIKRQIRKQDRIEVRSLTMEELLELGPISSKTTPSMREDTYSSNDGFLITFWSEKSDYGKYYDEPCEECLGFTASHAKCPLRSYMDTSEMKCVCEKGYQLQDDACVPVKESAGANYAAIIGGAVGGTLFIAISIGVVYRQRMNESVRGAEKKLYGIINPSELSFGNMLGRGSFGQVFKGEWRGAEVAIKVLINRHLSKEQEEAFKREISIMVELRHPNIVLYMGACFESENLCLVCELMHQGCLYDVLHQEKAIPLGNRLEFMSDICKGMQYLHMSNPPIIHRDLKSLNILVDDRNRLKVSDFGLTAIQGSESKEDHTGSLLWLAPEVIEGKEYTQSADVYSFGIIMWEILSRKDPYYEIENAFAVTTQVLMNQLRPTMPPNVPDEIQELIKLLWAQNPEDRPSFQQTSKKIHDLIESSASHSSFSPFSLSMSEDEIPPEGNVFVVSTRIFDSESLWEDIPEDMGDAVIMYNKLVKTESKKCRGYISQNDSESFVVIFQDGFEAIKFCSSLQVQLNFSQWPDGIKEHEQIKSQLDGELHGLRVQMGIDYGGCDTKYDTENKKKHYVGKTVSNSMRLSKQCQGGQILMTDSAYREIEDKIKAIEADNVVSKVKNIFGKQLENTYEICPKRIQKRASYFSKLRNENAKDDERNEKVEDTNHPHVPPSLPHIPTVHLAPLKPLNEAKNGRNVHNTSSHKVILEPLKPKEKVKKDWEINFEDLVAEKTSIGSGSYGSVFVGTFKERRVAIKSIGLGNNQTVDETYISFLSEVMIFRKLKHRNIVEFVGACTDLPRLAIVMELIEPGNLRQMLQDRSIILTKEIKIKIIRGVVEGMNYLHSLNPIVLHRDLKSANVLIDKNFESKICDFGFARVKANNRTMTKCGTLAYQAPEVMKGERYNEKADVYSFAILLWEIETREKPYHNKDQTIVQFEVLNGLRPELDEKMDEGLCSMMTSCWNRLPASRPRFQDLVNDPLFQ